LSSIPATEVEMESTTDQPNWLELPRDITANILQRLTTIEIVTSACQVCPLWWNICKDPLMWRTVHMTKLRHSSYNHGNNLVKICHYAVARSCGQLEDIEIEYFGTDDLLAFIADWYLVSSVMIYFMTIMSRCFLFLTIDVTFPR
jgi:hypothetical protein